MSEWCNSSGVQAQWENKTMLDPASFNYALSDQHIGAQQMTHFPNTLTHNLTHRHASLGYQNLEGDEKSSLQIKKVSISYHISKWHVPKKNR